MKIEEMSLKELLDRCIYNGMNHREEILTRFSTLEEKVKELEDTKEEYERYKHALPIEDFESLATENASLKSQVEGLKCCGNCKTRHHISSCPKRKFSSSSYGSTPLSSYCEAWQPDNLTRSERHG